jgi:hypothetical protein
MHAAPSLPCTRMHASHSQDVPRCTQMKALVSTRGLINQKYHENANPPLPQPPDTHPDPPLLYIFITPNGVRCPRMHAAHFSGARGCTQTRWTIFELARGCTRPIFHVHADARAPLRRSMRMHAAHFYRARGCTQMRWIIFELARGCTRPIFHVHADARAPLRRCMRMHAAHFYRARGRTRPIPKITRMHAAPSLPCTRMHASHSQDVPRCTQMKALVSTRGLINQKYHEHIP